MLYHMSVLNGVASGSAKSPPPARDSQGRAKAAGDQSSWPSQLSTEVMMDTPKSDPNSAVNSEPPKAKDEEEATSRNLLSATFLQQCWSSVCNLLITSKVACAWVEPFAEILFAMYPPDMPETYALVANEDDELKDVPFPAGMPKPHQAELWGRFIKKKLIDLELLDIAMERIPDGKFPYLYPEDMLELP